MEPGRSAHGEGDNVMARSCTRGEGCNGEHVMRPGKCNLISTAREDFDPYR